jgi:hypothetical protein
MDNYNFSYTFVGERGNEWSILMERGDLFINNISYERHDDDPTYDFAIAMHKVINEKP